MHARNLVALAVLFWPGVAYVSGPTSLEHRGRHVLVRMRAGPSIQFQNGEDERRHHEGERARLQPELDRLGVALEAAVARLVLDYDDAGPELDWSVLQSEVERDLARFDYSPYALQLLRQAQRKVPPPDTSTWDAILASTFTLVFSYPQDVGNVEVRVRVAARPRREQLTRLEAAIRAVVRPRLYPLRIATDAERTPAAGAVVTGEGVRTNRVVVRAVGAPERLAQRLARRFDAEIARVKDGATREHDRVFQFAIKKGGYRVAETPLGGGFTSPFLAEVPAQMELDVTLRTVETDNGGSLDRALVERMFELARKELPTLKRHDSPHAIDEIGPDDWVLVHNRS